MIYVTANTKFSDADPERNQKIIRNWNATVTNADTVIHLGVFSTERSRYYINQLKGLTVAVVRNGNAEFDGPKFKNLFLYADGTINQREVPGREDILCILQDGEEHLSGSKYPEIFAVDYGDWKFKNIGERIIGGDFSYLLIKLVVNANIDLWGYRPISQQMITEKYLCS